MEVDFRCETDRPRLKVKDSLWLWNYPVSIAAVVMTSGLVLTLSRKWLVKTALQPGAVVASVVVFR